MMRPMVTLRIRSMVWFATGITLALFAGVLVMQALNVDAAAGDEDSTFVPVSPCRLFDTRPGLPPESGKKTPLAAGASNELIQQVTGNIGACAGIPAGATAISMNVTILDPTAQSNLRVFPADVGTPDVSNLNWLAGQSPTPNKVDVELSPDGKIKFYNFAGTVNVIADVVGYYTNATLKELAAELAAATHQVAEATTKIAETSADITTLKNKLAATEPSIGTNESAIAASETAIANNNSKNNGFETKIGTFGNDIATFETKIDDFDNKIPEFEADIADHGDELIALKASHLLAVSGHAPGQVALNSQPKVIVDVTITAPVAGQVAVNYSTGIAVSPTNSKSVCAPIDTVIPPATIISNAQGVGQWETVTGVGAASGTVSGVAQFEIAAGATATYSLVCVAESGAGQALATTISAIFVPAL